jgi:hypothetical protein
MADNKKDIIRGYEKDLSELEKQGDELRKIFTDTAQSQQARNKAQRDYNALILTEENLLRKINKLQEKKYETETSLTEKLQERVKLLEQEGKNTKKLRDATKLLNSLTNDLNNATDGQLQKLVQEADAYDDMTSKAKTLNERIREQIEIWEAAQKSADDFLGDVSKGIAKLPIIGDSLSKGFDKFIKSEAGKKVRNKLAKKMFDPKVVGKSLKGAIGLGMMGAGIGLVGAGVSGALSREQELKDQQRSIGLTKKESESVDSMQRGLLTSFGTMVTSMEEARKASAELVDDFGKYGAENETLVDQQVKLTKAYGLQAEDASNFQRTAKIAGKDTETVKREVFAVASGFNKATGSTQSLSAVLRSVSKLSDAIRVQFRGSDTELTHAVMKAKMLGTTLEDLNGIADQLLNIESSIENQVTAQLVTGRNINLEKARYFALNDDMNGLMDELVKQEIDYASYSKMNRVEKQATAAALGMNVDQMAKFVSQQELAKQLNIDMSKAENQTSEGLERSLKSNQERIAQMAALGNEAAKQYERDNESLTNQEKMNKLVDIMLTTFKFLAPVLVGVGVAITVIGFALIKAALAAAGLSVALSGGTLTWAIIGGIAATTAAIIGMYALTGMATGGDVVGGQGPVVVGEKGPEIVHLRKGNSVTPNSQLNTVTGGNNKETNDLLRQLIAKVDQPAIIKMGDTTINEMGNKTTLNRNYQAEA